MADILTVKDLKAYYLMNYYGVRREVRAVDDITMTIRRDEVYGLAGESSSGKTTLIKVLAAAIRPPLTVVAGSVRSTIWRSPSTKTPPRPSTRSAGSTCRTSCRAR